MKNPQNYKKYYKRWNELREEIYKAIRDELFSLPGQSLDLRTAESWCILENMIDSDDYRAMGIVLNMDHTITVYGGVYEVDNTYNLENDLNTATLLRLYKVFEEAITEYTPEEFLG